MKINQKVHYALECLFELSKNAGAFVDAERLAATRNIPHAYAQKVLQALAQAGLVRSLKGNGYQLGRPLQYITALDVINALNSAEAVPEQGAGRALARRIDDALANVTLDVLSVA
jgi:Rrf2 family protein